MNEITEIRGILGVNRTEFSKLTEIPLRTLEAWENDKRVPPPYLAKFLRCYVEHELKKE